MKSQPKETEIKKKTIYYKKVYQQIFDEDDKLRSILRTYHSLLPNIDGIELEFTICNKTDDKIRRFLS